ncbi:MAG: ABC transporter permease [Firmicutes bacterium]|nr:ABC transporter permease [Bacillota bacterium]
MLETAYVEQEFDSCDPATPGDSAASDLLRALRSRKAGMIGLSIVAVFLVVAALAPFLMPNSFDEPNLTKTLQGPSAQYPLGTDEIGRCVLSRLIYGSRISLSVGLVAVGTGLAIGMVVGVASGLFGGWVDQACMTLVDIVWSFPTILLAIGLVSVMKPGLAGAMIALGLVTWPSYARVVRGQVMAVRGLPFVLSARASGCGTLRLLSRHIIPNIMSPVLVMASLEMGNAIIVESTLSYLGLGVQPPYPSWGTMLSTAKNFTYDYPMLMVYPGAAIVVVVLGFNLFGDAVRDALDPRLR